MAQSFMIAILCASIVATASAEGREGASAMANPIRKVVTILQGMSKKIKKEGEEEVKLHEAYKCAVKKSTAEITVSIAANEDKLPPLETNLVELTTKLTQLKADLKKAQEDTAAANKALEDSAEQRASENKVFVTATSELPGYIDSLTKGIAALEKGNSGSFLQAQGMTWTLQNVLESSMALDEDSKQEVTVFLSGKAGYQPASGKIVGMLKVMLDEAQANFNALKAAEAGSLKSNNKLVAAKTKEIDSLRGPMQDKTERIAETSIAIPTLKQDILEAKEELATDKKFARDLKKTSEDKQAIYEKDNETREGEMVAVDETIKILNDDDALETFKKARPSASASLLQLDTSNSRTRLQANALSIVSALRSRATKRSIWGHSDLDLLELALKNGKVDFSSIEKKIDEMVEVLKLEQSTDEAKVEQCEKSMAASTEQIKVFNYKLKQIKVNMADKKDGLSTLVEEMATTAANIKQLDEDVKEATSQRKKENAQTQAIISANTPAMELLNMAKAKLDSFYNPPKKTASTERDRDEFRDAEKKRQGTSVATTLIVLPGQNGADSSSFVQISSHMHVASQETSTYKMQHTKSNVVTKMLEKLILDLKNEIILAKAGEKRSQADFEKTVEESATRRAEMAEKLAKKGAIKADLESDVVDKVQVQKSETALKLDAQKLEMAMKSDCEFIMNNLEARTGARNDEIEDLKNTKMTLHGVVFVQSAKLRGAKAL